MAEMKISEIHPWKGEKIQKLFSLLFYYRSYILKASVFAEVFKLTIFELDFLKPEYARKRNFYDQNGWRFWAACN